jgi:hypothetical protein
MGETDVVVTDQVLTTKPSLFSFPLFLFLVSIILIYQLLLGDPFRTEAMHERS